MSMIVLKMQIQIKKVSYVESHLMRLGLKVEEWWLKEREEGSSGAHNAIQTAKVACWKTINKKCIIIIQLTKM